MIDDDLGTICKITKLSLPKSKGVWIGLSITELVSKDSKLRQVRVGGDELSLKSFFLDALVDGVVVTVLVLVPDVSVSVGECTSLNILSRKSHVVTFVNERGECQSLGGSPVDIRSVGDILVSLLKNLANKPVEYEFLWQIRDLKPNIFDLFKRDTTEFAFSLVALLDGLPLGVGPVL